MSLSCGCTFYYRGTREAQCDLIVQEERDCGSADSSGNRNVTMIDEGLRQAVLLTGNAGIKNYRGTVH
jgi:hypothetical protein